MPIVHLLKGHLGGNQVPCGRLTHMSDKGFTHLDRSPKTLPMMDMIVKGETAAHPH